MSTAAQGEGAGCAGAPWRAAQPVTELVGPQLIVSTASLGVASDIVMVRDSWSLALGNLSRPARAGTAG